MKKLSVCIPAYNRHQFMNELLDSIIEQSDPSIEIVICEDKSPERELIRQCVEKKSAARGCLDQIKYFENDENLGYDANLRNLMEKSTGEYCLFMGNDDILMPGAIHTILKIINQYPDVGVITRAYKCFSGNPENVKLVIKQLPQDELFMPGPAAIRFFFRRVGVLSGLVFKREPAVRIATNQFDGHLYYQMYMAGMLLKEYYGYYIADFLTLSRADISPDFGNAANEKEKFTPGRYTADARVCMVEGLLKIADTIDDTTNKVVYDAVKKDISIYFYPYIRDQLRLPFREYLEMVRNFMRLGMKNEIYFYAHCILGYILKSEGYDFLIGKVRKMLGHSPRIGI